MEQHTQNTHVSKLTGTMTQSQINMRQVLICICLLVGLLSGCSSVKESDDLSDVYSYTAETSDYQMIINLETRVLSSLRELQGNMQIRYTSEEPVHMVSYHGFLDQVIVYDDNDRSVVEYGRLDSIMDEDLQSDEYLARTQDVQRFFHELEDLEQGTPLMLVSWLPLHVLFGII